jgi:hypothetical protein
MRWGIPGRSSLGWRGRNPSLGQRPKAVPSPRPCRQPGQLHTVSKVHLDPGFAGPLSFVVSFVGIVLAQSIADAGFGGAADDRPVARTVVVHDLPRIDMGE